ncbi:MAG: hypothetical protein ABJA78_09855 [Ferruginibacter sp.]
MFTHFLFFAKVGVSFSADVGLPLQPAYAIANVFTCDPTLKYLRDRDNGSEFKVTVINQHYPEYYPQFSTATILNWQHLLAKDEYKNVIIQQIGRFQVSRWSETRRRRIMG